MLRDAHSSSVCCMKLRWWVRLEQLRTVEQYSKMMQIVLFVGVIFIGFNLRPSITAVGPLIGTIRDDVGFANWSVALLTSLPLVAFAIMSPLAPKLGHKLTNERALAVGLLILMIGIAIRSIKVIPLIFLGTLAIGLGIAICNVLLPSFIKSRFPLKIGLMTSLYSTCMALLATISSGVSAPLAEGLHLGWSWALFVWIIPAVFAFFLWVYIARKLAGDNERSNTFTGQKHKTRRTVWKSYLAWMVALFMGFQSTVYYVTISWLPELLMDSGFTKISAGYMLSYFQFLAIPFSFIVPILAVRLHNQIAIVLIANIAYIVGIIGLLFGGSLLLYIASVTLIGAASSSNFALALSFLSIRAKNAHDAANLSGMAQSIGYIIAAVGPVLIGYIYDITKAWTIPLISLIIIALCIICFGFYAGQRKYVLK